MMIYNFSGSTANRSLNKSLLGRTWENLWEEFEYFKDNIAPRIELREMLCFNLGLSIFL